MCTRAISYDQSLTTYHQSDMPIYRKMVGRHIIRGSLKEPGDGSFPYYFDLRNILQGSLLDSNNQSVPYMFQLSVEHQQTAQSKHAKTSLTIPTSFFSRKTNKPSQRQMTTVQPQKCQQYSINSAAATVEEVYSVDSEEDDDDDEPTEEGTNSNLTNTYSTSSQRQMTHNTTHVQPQRRQFSTNSAAVTTVDDEDSVDSEEEDDYKPTEEGTNPNKLNNTYSQPFKGTSK